MEALRAKAHPRGAKALVLFTHPGHRARRWPAVVWALNRSTRVLSMSSVHARSLRRAGVSGRRLRVEIPGVDEQAFSSHERTGENAVLVSSAYYPRKAGEKWVEIARLLPDRQFVVVGRGWGASPLGGAIDALHNVRLLDDVPYAEYAAIYAGCDVYLSTSVLEGGPMPLLEAMMSNLVPVVSATGFAPDVVQHGTSGFLYPVRTRPAAIVPLIEAAFRSTADARAAVAHLTPKRYADAVWSEVEGSSRGR
jgi:glycosyltransferase involved in cell wall biosynthesis